MLASAPSDLGATDANVRDLAEAAARLDGDAMRPMAQASIAEYGAMMTWDQLIRPVWDRLRTRPDDAGAELVFSRAMTEALAVVRPRRTVFPSSVLLASADEEGRALPLTVLAAALGESGARCSVLGAPVSAGTLSTAIGRLRPGIAVIWTEPSDTTDAGELRTVIATSARCTLIAAGPGWDAVAVPAGVIRPGDVGTATVLVLALLAAASGVV